jgi:hypothetical protein
MHSVQVAAEFHYKFIRIHPFDDGNGRIARLLVNYVLIRNGYTPIIIKSDDKENYLAALRRGDAGDMEPFNSYIAEQQKWSLKLEIKAAKGESVEEPDDIDKEIALLKRELKHKNVLEEKGTYENIYKAIKENILPLFKMLDQKANTLKELFFDYGRFIRCSIYGGANDKEIGAKESEWNNIEAWFDDSERVNHQIKKVSFGFELRGLKKSIAAPHIWMNIDVFFEAYNYNINTNIDNNVKIFSYGKLISEEEKKGLVNVIIKNVINRIKDTQ